MPTIPTLTNQVRTEAAPNFQQRPLQSTAAESIGAGLSDVSNVVFRVRQEEQLKADRAAFMDADRHTDTVANELISNSQTLQGKDAIGSSPKLLEEFDKSAAATEQGLRSKRSKLAYRESVNARRAALQRQLDGHEGSQREAYYAKSREDFKDQAHINAVTNYRDPQAIDIELKKVRGAIEQTPGMDDAQRATEFGVRRSSIYAGVIDRYLANGQVGRAQKYYDSIKNQVNGDRATTIEAKIADTAHALSERAKVQMAEARAGRILNAYASDGPEAGVRAMTELVRSEKLTQEQLGDVYSKVQQGLNLARNAKQEEHADEIAELHQNLSNGSAGLDDVLKVEALWKDNALSPTERASLIGQIEGSHIAKAGSQGAAIALQDALQNGTPLSPSNSDHRKALAAAFGQDASAVPIGSGQFQQLAIAYAAKTRMLPEQALQWMQAAVRSPRPSVAAKAAQFYGAVQVASPDALSMLDEDSRSMAGMVNSMIEAGTDPEKAVEVSRANVLETKPEIRAQRRKQYDTEVKSSPGALKNFIDRDMDPSWFANQPAATTALQADFDSQAGRYYEKVGDIELARKLAWSDLTRVYGPTAVNGAPTVSAFPIERFGVKPEEVRADVASFLATNPQAEGTTADDVLIVPDALTLRQASDALSGQSVRPSYSLITKGGDTVLDGNGVRARYTIPSGEDLARRIRETQAAAEAQAREQVDAARRRREAVRDLKANAELGGAM